MNPVPEVDRVLLAHMRDCLDRILEYMNAERARFDAGRERPVDYRSRRSIPNLEAALQRRVNSQAERRALCVPP